MKYLGIDIGGTWIKGTMIEENSYSNENFLKITDLDIKKIRSPLHANTTPNELIEALKALISAFQIASGEINGIGISTAGIVNYSGTNVLKTAEHLNILKNDGWKNALEKELHCTASIINDADAATIGLAETGFLTGSKTVGVMPIGTGLGFTVWRNGRRWRPGKSLTLLGSIRTPEGAYDSIASATRLASVAEYNLANVFTNNSFQEKREWYLKNLCKIINSAAILYNLDEVIICGGLADAVNACNYPLEQLLNDSLQATPVELEKSVKVIVAREGNRLQLIGALALAKGESVAIQNKIVPCYNSLDTEIPYRKEMQLQNMQTLSIIETLWQAEQEAGDLLRSSIPILADIADVSVARIKAGGRIIYIGAGTSGRIAAADAIEVPCTYGFPEDRIVALIAGGVSDASIEIESDFEEDASAVPEMLLLNIQPEDVVFGVSASGATYYVQSALAFAKDRGALSVMIQAKLPDTELTFCDYVIPLNSGNEVLAGSTRMKGGTATKKILNFLSSTIMIKMGKVAGAYMIDVACINNKLVERAQYILKILYNIDKEEAFMKLKSADMNLGQVIKNIESNFKILK